MSVRPSTALPERLLRRRVADGADELPRRRQAADRTGVLGEPEVREVGVVERHRRAPVDQEHVGWLDVAVHEAPLVRGAERPGDLRADRNRPLDLQRAAGADQPAQVWVLDLAHARCRAGRRPRPRRRSGSRSGDRCSPPPATRAGSARGSCRPRRARRRGSSARPSGRGAGPGRGTPPPCRRERAATRAGTRPPPPRSGAAHASLRSRGPPAIGPPASCMPQEFRTRTLCHRDLCTVGTITTV